MHNATLVRTKLMHFRAFGTGEVRMVQGEVQGMLERDFLDRGLEAPRREKPSKSPGLNCRWGFGWVDKAQCFCSARWFGAVGLTFSPPTFQCGEHDFSHFLSFSCWKWCNFTNFMVDKYSQISIRWWKTFNFSFSALFFSQVPKKTTESFFAWRKPGLFRGFSRHGASWPMSGKSLPMYYWRTQTNLSPFIQGMFLSLLFMHKHRRTDT